jgi:DNA-binding NarL/FixJ family response regulator
MLKPEDRPPHDLQGLHPEEEAMLVRDIVNNFGEVVYRYRLWPTQGYEYIGESVLNLLGHPAADFYADPLLPNKLVHPDDAELMRSVLGWPAGQEAGLHLRWVRPSGEVVHTEIQCVVTRDTDGRVILIDGVARLVQAGAVNQERLELIQWRSRLREGHEENASARIVIADDHQLTRAGLRAVLTAEPGLDVVGEASDGREAVVQARALQPDLVLMDLRMPDMDGLEATREQKRSCPMTSVLILTMFDDIELLMDAVRAGAAGYVLKGASETALRTAIWEALVGDLAVDARLAREVLRRLANEPPTKVAAGAADLLSTREHEVLGLVARGLTNREIAKALTITSNTVKVHVEHILAKMGVSDRTQAAVQAIELGYIVPEQQHLTP